MSRKIVELEIDSDHQLKKNRYLIKFDFFKRDRVLK